MSEANPEAIILTEDQSAEDMFLHLANFIRKRRGVLIREVNISWDLYASITENSSQCPGQARIDIRSEAERGIE